MAIDGVNVTNQGYGALGSYSIVFGSLGNATPFDFVKEVQVKTGGYEAGVRPVPPAGVLRQRRDQERVERTSVVRCSVTRVREKTEGHVDPDDFAERHDPTSPGTHAQRCRRRRSADRSEGPACSSSARSIRRGTPAPAWCRPTSLPAGAPGLRCWRRSRTAPIAIARTKTATLGQGHVPALTRPHRFDASFFGDPSEWRERAAARQRAAQAQDTARFASARSEYGGHNQTVRYDGVISNNFLLEGFYALRPQPHRRNPVERDWSASTTPVRLRRSPAASDSTSRATAA